jgi:hypothetical protein
MNYYNRATTIKDITFDRFESSKTPFFASTTIYSIMHNNIGSEKYDSQLTTNITYIKNICGSNKKDLMISIKQHGKIFLFAYNLSNYYLFIHSMFVAF